MLRFFQPCCIVLTATVLMQMKETPLIRAAHNGHLQMVQFLMEQGADVDCIDLVSGLQSISLPAPLQLWESS